MTSVVESVKLSAQMNVVFNRPRHKLCILEVSNWHFGAFFESKIERCLPDRDGWPLRSLEIFKILKIALCQS